MQLGPSQRADIDDAMVAKDDRARDAPLAQMIHPGIEQSEAVNARDSSEWSGRRYPG